MKPEELIAWQDNPNTTTDDYIVKRAIDAYVFDTRAGVFLGVLSLVFSLVVVLIPNVEKEVKLAALGVTGFGELAAAVMSKSSISKTINSYKLSSVSGDDSGF